MTKEKATEDERSKFFAYFLLFFPTIIVIGVPNTIDGSVLLPMMLKALLAFYQFVSIKNFVDKYYGN